MVDEDDRIIDQSLDQINKKIEDLKEMVSSYSLLIRQAPDDKLRKDVKFKHDVVKQLMELHILYRDQYEQVNKQAKLIIKLRQEIQDLKNKS